MRNVGMKRKEKILFVAPPIILALLTCIWYFGTKGRWYHYREKLAYKPLLVCHLIMPLYYLVRLIIASVKQSNVNTRSSSNVFCIVVSIILCLLCIVGLFVFLVFTSGV